MAETIISQKISRVNWEPYVFTNNQSRIFYANSMVLVNQGTGNISINGIFTMLPGDSLSLDCDQNEIDYTVYKIIFVPGATTNKLAIFVKINENSRAILSNIKVLPPIDRRLAAKQYVKKGKRGDF